MDAFAPGAPHSAEAEQAVIGSMLISPSCVPDVLPVLRADDFYFPQNKTLYEAFVSMFTAGETIDAVTLQEYLESHGQLSDVGGTAYLAQLIEITPTAAHVLEYARIVSERALMRSLGEIGTKITNMVAAGEGGAREMLENAERMVYELRRGRESRDMLPIKTVLLDVMADLESLYRNKGKLPGIPTGIEALDSYISGLNKSDLILLASRPGMGKTSFALNIAFNAAKQSGKAVAIFQLEMSREQLASRLLSSTAAVAVQKLRSGDIVGEEWGRIALATNLLSRQEIYIDDNPGIGVAEMKSKCRRLGDRLGLVVIDYLQLMTGGKKYENRVTEVADISRSLKIMAKELNVPVLCCSQLSRATEQRADKKPMLSDLRESGSIEQDADIVMFLYREDYYNKESAQKDSAELIIAKNRHGSTDTIPLKWQGQFTRFGSVDTRHEGA